MVDDMDERKEWWEVSAVDIIDLIWLESNPDDPAFSPVVITEEWVLNLGFEKEIRIYDYYCIPIDASGYSLSINVKTGETLIGEPGKWLGLDITTKHVHQLQNLFFALRGGELEIRKGAADV